MCELSGTHGLFSEGRRESSKEPALSALSHCFTFWFHLFMFLYETAIPLSLLFPAPFPLSNHSSIVPVGAYRERNACFPSLLFLLKALSCLCSSFLTKTISHHKNMILWPHAAPENRTPIIVVYKNPAAREYCENMWQNNLKWSQFKVVTELSTTSRCRHHRMVLAQVSSCDLGSQGDQQSQHLGTMNVFAKFHGSPSNRQS